MNPNRYRAAAIISLLVFSLSALGMVLFATRWGVGASPDSVVYLVGARNLANGSGFGMPAMDGTISPITHHAPFYSFLLALGERIGINAMQWGRFINILLLIVTIWAVVQIVRQWTPQVSMTRDLFAFFAAALLLSPVFMVEIFSMAWTEGLFIALFLVSLLFLDRYRREPASRWLAAAGTATGLALLTRYAGAALVPAFCLAILLFSSQAFPKRLVRAVMFGIISTAPLGLWVLRNQLTSGSATSREFLYHPFVKGQISQALTTMSSWLLVPVTAPTVVKILFLLLTGCGLLYVLWRRTKRNPVAGEPPQPANPLPGTIQTLLIFIPIYFIFLGFSLSFFDANTPLDGRILSPIYASLLILSLYLAGQALLFGTQWRTVLGGIAVLALILISANLVKSTSFVKTAYQNGIGFTSPAWRNSQLLALLEDLPANTPVYTNAPEPIQLYTDRLAASLPRKLDVANRLVISSYSADMDQLQRALANGQAIAAFFNSLERPNLANAAEIEKLPGVEKIRAAADGVIYGSASLK